eukprot:m.1399183 g.1399183  ORF g.1399183 m.1399183 type:complete len:1289 (+) comp25001_c1_seq3:369-4235(+)
MADLEPATISGLRSHIFYLGFYVVSTGAFIAWIGGQWLYMVGAAAIAVCHYLRKSRAVRRTQGNWLLRNAHRYGIVSAAGFEIPKWINFSATEKCNWLTTVVAQLWPYTKIGLEHALRENLDPILDWACPAVLSSLKFKRLQLGHKPPVILGVNTLETACGVSIDVTVQFSGHSDVIIIASSGPLVVPVELSDLVVQGVLRITLAAPTTDNIPGFKAVTITFVKKPTITFNLSAVEIPLTQIPGLSEAITHAVQNGIAGAVVWPWSVIVPLMDAPHGLTADERATLEDRSAQGVLRVTIVRAEGLSRPTLMRVADPYVMCTLNGVDAKKTSTKEGTANPKWDEVLEWVVYDWATATFQCDVQDTGIMTRIVKSLGHASVDLASLQPHQQYRMRLPLHSGHGFVSVRMVYHPFATLAAGDVVPSFVPRAQPLSTQPPTPGANAVRRRPHTTSTSDTDDVARFSTAFLFVEVLGCSGLPTGSSARVCITCNGIIHRTTALLGNETHYQGYEQYGEAYFFPLQSLTSSAMVHVEEVDEVGDVRTRIELLDGSDRLRFGSKPIKHVCTLLSFDCSVKVVLKIAIKYVDNSACAEERGMQRNHAALYEEKLDNTIVNEFRRGLFKEVVAHGGLYDTCVCLGLAALAATAYVCVHIASASQVAMILTAVVAAVLSVVFSSANSAASWHADTSRVIPSAPATDPTVAPATVALSPMHQALLVKQFPPWLIQPDAEKSEWVNDAIELLWPNLRASVEASVAALLRSADAVPLLRVECSLGATPPVVTAVKCYPQTARGSNVIIDASVSFVGDARVCATWSRGLLSASAAVHDVAVHACLRMEFGPPVPHVPPFAGVQLSVVDISDLDFALSVLGLPITSIPGVAALLRRGLHAQLVRTVHIPHGVHVPVLTTSTDRAEPECVGLGLLRIYVRRAIGLPQRRVGGALPLGLSTVLPYCTADVTGEATAGQPRVTQRCATATATNSLNPQWNEPLELIVPGTGASLRLCVRTHDVVGTETLLGRTRDIAIADELAPNTPTNCGMALSTAAASVGTLNVELEWKPFLPSVTSRRLTDSHNEVEWSVGVVFVNVLGCYNVIATHDSSAVTYVQVSVGGETKQTRTRVGSSPVFNTGFHFLIRYVAQQQVHFRVVDNRAGSTVGVLKFNISDVVHSGGSLAGLWDLNGSGDVKMEVSLTFRAVSAAEERPSFLTVAAPAGYPATPPATPAPSSAADVDDALGTKRLTVLRTFVVARSTRSPSGAGLARDGVEERRLRVVCNGRDNSTTRCTGAVVRGSLIS